MSTETASTGAAPPPTVLVMGVTACGKTTIGEELARRLGVPFADADAFHPEANIAKMSSGTPLTDEDRWPWLAECGRWLAGHSGTGAVLACSALRVVYRDALREHAPTLFPVHLAGPLEVAAERVAARKGHFMPTALVQSQYDTLEDLEEAEGGVVIPFDLPVDRIVDLALAALGGGAPTTGVPA